MNKLLLRLLILIVLLLLILQTGSSGVLGATNADLKACEKFAFSTEEDFLTRGPVPSDGNPIISDGDLLSDNHTVCMRNWELLQVFDIDSAFDLGLDAVDVLLVEDDRGLVAFSTELNAPDKRFTAGDLLTTWGAIIPNQSLLILFQIQPDRGLDAVHFVGDKKAIVAFNEFAATVPRERWLEERDLLVNELRRYGVDIWFSIEGTERRASVMPVFDGDLLSAGHGVIVARNEALLPPFVPAGILSGGVDFGLDGFTASRVFDPPQLFPIKGHFTTEILYEGEITFTDGDVLAVGNGVVYPDHTLYAPFEPKADFLGTDALYILLDEPTQQPEDFLPLILKAMNGGGL